MSKKQIGLGRGLSALIGDEVIHAAANDGDQTIRLTDIEPNVEQPRKYFDDELLQELADSLLTHGVISPLTVRRLPSGRYQIIDGERRWRAARLAKLDSLPVRIFDADDRLAAEMALIQNLQREDLAPLEEALGFQKLIDDYGLTQEETAERVGKSRPAIANALRLLALSPVVQALLEQNEMTAGHARALLGLNVKSIQEKAAKQVVAETLSVRQTEALVKKLLAPEKPAPVKDEVQELHVAKLQETMTAQYGRKVSISHSARKGTVLLEYYGLDDLDALLEQLNIKKD